MLDRTAVIVPALDEAETIVEVIRRLPAGVRVVVVDNGSSDDTAALAREAGAEVVHEARRGYGTAVQAGAAHLAADPPEFLAILDADLADDPDRLPELVAPLAADRADFVLSDRTRLADPGALTAAQHAGNAIATSLIAAMTGHRFRDLGPFRAMRFTTFQALGLTDPTWGWNVEMQLAAVDAGLRILEIPLPYRKRHAGQSKISGTIVGTMRAGYRILATLAAYRLSRPRPS